MLAKKGLMCQDENGAWGFPNFAKQQRNANLRVRSDGLGSSELGHNRRKIGAPDIDIEDSKESVQKKDKRSTSVPPTSAEGEGVGLSESGMTVKQLVKRFMTHFQENECKYIIKYLEACLAPTQRQAFHDHGTIGNTTKLRNIILELTELADGKQLTYKWQPVPIVDHETLVRTMAMAARGTSTRFETNNFLKSKLQLGIKDTLDIYGVD
jgi:hypothetical protein